MMARRWPVFLGLALVGLLLLAALVYISDPLLVWAELYAVGAWGLLVVLANVLCSLLAAMTSWYVLLRSAGILVPRASSAGAYICGYAVNYVTPVMYLGGEPVRVYLVARRTGVPMARVAATVVVERLLASLSVLAFVSIGIFFVLGSPGISPADKRWMEIGLGIAVAFVLAVLFSFVRDYRWLSRLITWLAKHFSGRGRTLRAAARVAETEREVYVAFAQRLPHTLLALLLQLASVFFSYLRPQVFLHFTQSPLCTFPQLSFYFTLNFFLTMFLWITPGGVGIAEGGRMGIFSLIGMMPSQALAFSVLFRGAELIIVVVGLYLLAHQGVLRVIGQEAQNIPSGKPEPENMACGDEGAGEKGRKNKGRRP
jgi:uncharacterized protein (TIRG00374 family)